MNNYIINQVEHNGLRLTIKYDTDLIDPREDLCSSKMVCFHRNYNLPNESDYDYKDYGSWKELEQAIIKENDIAVILPVWMYDHSSISLSTGRTCSWDSMQVGFIYITKPMVRKLRNCKYVTEKILKAEAEFLIEQIRLYTQYLNGDVYYFKIEECKKVIVNKTYSNGDQENFEELEFEEIDSCGNLYSKDSMKETSCKEYHELFDLVTNF